MMIDLHGELQRLRTEMTREDNKRAGAKLVLLEIENRITLLNHRIDALENALSIVHDINTEGTGA